MTAAADRQGKGKGGPQGRPGQSGHKFSRDNPYGKRGSGDSRQFAH